MTVSRGHQLVEGLRSDLNCRLEAEGEVGGRQVIVDRLGHAHHVDADIHQLLGDPLGAVTANVDDCLEAHLLQPLFHQLGTVLGFPGTVRLPHGKAERASLVGSLDDGTAPDMQTRHALFCQPHQFHLVSKNTVERLYATIYLPLFWLQHSSLDNAANHSIQTRTITTSRGHQYFMTHNLYF